MENPEWIINGRDLSPTGANYTNTFEMERRISLLEAFLDTHFPGWLELLKAQARYKNG